MSPVIRDLEQSRLLVYSLLLVMCRECWCTACCWLCIESVGVQLACCWLCIESVGVQLAVGYV